MSKRVNNSKGTKSKNCGLRNNKWNRYMQMMVDEANASNSVDTIEQIKKMYVSAKQSIGKLVPKGASKMLSSLVRQRT